MAEKKNPHAQALGRLGASKGGKARARKLSAERSKEIAQKAIQARWEKYRQEKKGGGANGAESVE